MSNKQNPPSIDEGQVVKVWQFTQNSDGSLSPGGASSGSDVNVAKVNGSAPALTNPLPVELSDGTQSVGTSGNPLNVNVISGGGSNASVGATGATAPASATEIGIIDGSGKLQGASATNPVPVKDSVSGVVDANNSTTAVLGIGGVFTGTSTDMLSYVGLSISLFADQASAANGFQIQFSSDNTNWVTDQQSTVTASQQYYYVKNRHDRFFRVVYTNGGVAQGAFRLQVILQPFGLFGHTPAISESIDQSSDGILTKSVITGQSSAGGGTLINVKVNPSGALQTQDGIDVAPGTTAPSLVGIVGGKTNDGTPQYQPIPEGAGGRSIIVEGIAGGTAQPVSAASLPLPSNAAQETGGNLATLAGAVSGGLVQENIADWGGAAVSAPPASGVPAVGTEVAPVVKPIQRKSDDLFTTANILGSATYTSAWFDTQQTGAVAGFITWLIPTTGFASNALRIDISDDQTNILTPYMFTPTVSTLAGSFFNIGGRYWRVRFLNGANQQTSPLISVVTFQSPISILAGINGSTGALTNIATSTSSALALMLSSAFSENLAVGAMPNVLGTSMVLPTASMVAAGNPNSGGTVMAVERTPTTFKAGQGSAVGLNTIWTPTVTKKFRLMRYKIEVAPDVILSAAGPVNLSFVDGAINGSFGPALQHRIWLPSAAPTTSANQGYQTDWIDLGNGYLSGAAGNNLSFTLSTPLAASSTPNPAWTQTSGQWAAGAESFKTPGGNACIIQSKNASGTTTAAPAFTNNNQAGNLIVVVALTKSASATLTVSDTLSNSYTSLAAIQNATDGTTLRMFYATSCKGGANTVTVAGGTTNTKAIAVEYGSVGILIDGAQTSATGNNTAPTPGALAATAQAGDLILGYAGNGQNANALTAGSGYATRNTLSDSSSTLAIEDNIGQASLSAGVINVIAVGTEE